MRPNNPNRTPFDNNLVNDPNAPRHTQPLPSSAPPAQSGAGKPQAGMPHAGMPRTLPPQVVTGALDDDDSDLYSRRPRRRQGLPSATVVGAAMMIGALAVILVLAVVSRMLPRAQTPPLRPQDAPAADLVIRNSKTVVQTPAATPAEAETPPEAGTANEPAPTNGDAPVVVENEDGTGEPVASEGEEPAGREDRIAAGDERRSERGRDAEQARERARESEQDRRSAEEGDRRAEPSRDEREAGEEQSGKERTRGGRHFVSERRGYAITPPAGFTLQQSGRRTIWQGPGGAQLLVETASVGERSARADWERMDKSFRKKYGNRYRSHGIYDTTLAGRPAAVWEFEIDGPRGTTRKIDVAVHHRGRGYAVLGSAPATRFERVRPQIEEAIQSFQLSRDGDSRGNSERERQDDDADNRGY